MSTIPISDFPCNPFPKKVITPSNQVSKSNTVNIANKLKKIETTSILTKLIESSKNSNIAKSILGTLGVIGFGTSSLFELFEVDIGFKKKIENMHNGFLFKPDLSPFPPPDKSKVNFEEVFIEKPNEPKLNGYFFKKEKSDLAIIFLHGYNGSADECYPECLKIQEHIPANVLVVDYRGFGRSEGKPTREGVISDSLNMYNYLIDKGFKGKNIILYGASLGGPIACEVAKKLKDTNKELGALVTLYSFSSVKDISKWRHPYIPSNFILDDIFNAKRLVKRLNIPVFIAHGDKDLNTPLSQSIKIFNAANDPKELYVLPNVGHEDLYKLPKEQTEGYFYALKSFVEKNIV